MSTLTTGNLALDKPEEGELGWGVLLNADLDDLDTAISALQDGTSNVISVNGETGTVTIDAGDIGFTPAGTIAAVTVQAAIEEVATDAAADLATHEGDTSNPHSVDKTDVGLANVLNTLHNLDAISAPGAGDDTGDGYQPGSVWVDVSGDVAYICLDATVGAAVWEALGSAADVFPSGTQGDILYYNGSDWVALNAGTSGQFLKTQGTGANPAWATPDYSDTSIWATGPVFTRSSDSQFTVTDNASNQTIFIAGRPIRYRAAAGTWRYGIVTAYSLGTVTIAGAPMTVNDADEIAYADTNRVMQVDINISAGFNDAADTALIANDALSALKWQRAGAYLVRISHIVGLDDSGLTQPNVNATVAGTGVSNSNTSAGRAVAETWTNTAVDIDTAAYAIAFGDAIEIAVDGSGANGDAEDLTVSLVFVQE